MVRVWSSYRDAEKAVETIQKIMEQRGDLPETYAKAVRETLQHSYKGVIQRFYEKLSEKCPQALKHF